MNIHEERAWKRLIELGAREFTLGGKHALDLKPIRATTEKKLCLLVQAVVAVVGRSGANRRHVDRRGCPVYVVTDYYTIERPNDGDRHEPERLALLAKTKARKAAVMTEDEVREALHAGAEVRRLAERTLKTGGRR